MLRLIVGLLIILWLIGLIGHIAGSFVYILLVIAAIVFVIDVVTRRGSV